MKWVLVVIGGVVAMVGLIAAVGAFLPRGHVARRTVVLAQPPERVWAVIADFPGQTAWRAELRAVERGDDRDGKPVWREIPKRGDAMLLETTAMEPPRRLVRTIADPSLPFGGRWIYELAPAGGGTRLTIVEEGEVRNPIFRFMSRFFLDPSATIEGYLRALATRFGEPARFEPD